MFNLYIVDLGCQIVWTGGWTATPGNPDPSVWNWYYTNDLVNGPSDLVTYIAWGAGEPNNVRPGEPFIALLTSFNLNFVDVPEYIAILKHCFFCEYP